MLEVFRYRDLIRTLVARDLKVRYKRSVIGFVWTMLQPLLTMIVLDIVFSTVFRFDIKNYPVYALTGIVFWNFFSQTIVASMNSLKVNTPILQKVPVPMEIFPLSALLSGIINLIFAIIPLLLIMVVTGYKVTWAVLFLPVSILIVSIFTLGAGLLLSPSAVFFSDVVELVGVILTMLFYMTPIFWPLSILEESKWLVIIKYNPIRSILEVFRDPIYFGKIPPVDHIAWATLVALTVFALGYWAFRRSADRIPFYL